MLFELPAVTFDAPHSPCDPVRSPSSIPPHNTSPRTPFEGRMLIELNPTDATKDGLVEDNPSLVMVVMGCAKV